MNMVFEEGAEAVSQEEQKQALVAELAALEGLLDYLDTLQVVLARQVWRNRILERRRHDSDYS